jgi:DNA-binding MarR family transcriptional regulator
MRALPADVAYVGSGLPSVLLFGDEPQRRARLADEIARAGGRVVASGPLSVAMERLDQRVASVVVDVGIDDGAADGGAALDAILDRLNGLGASGRLSALVLTPAELIDVVVARIDDPGIDILVDPDASERDAALAELVALPAGRVTEEGEADRRRRLAQLGEEVGRIARALAALSAGSSEPARAASADGAAAPVVSDAPLVRAILRLRRLRGLHFEPALFADPAWDILLDLAAARIEGRMVAVSSLCIAAVVPATTALRWISQMTDQGLLVRHPDAQDGRRVFIALADATATAMDAYLAAARRIVAPVA